MQRSTSSERGAWILQSFDAVLDSNLDYFDALEGRARRQGGRTDLECHAKSWQRAAITERESKEGEFREQWCGGWGWKRAASRRQSVLT